MELKDKDFFALRDYMQKNYGIDLSKKRDLIQSRLSMTVSQKGFTDFASYIDNLIRDTTGAEASMLVSKLTTNYTYFMREDAHYKFLTETVLPQMTPHIKDRVLRTWSAGCSSGEEPYTLAMVYDAYFGSQKHLWDTVVLASDISDKVLAKAREGVYTDDKMGHLPKDWQHKYFVRKSDGQYEINRQIKREVEFRKFNLMEKQFKFKKPFHIIFCRNVMIYFNTPTRKELVERFYDVLEPGGYLFTGLSESIMSLGTKFVGIRPAVYRK